ncbi:MAG: YraN family protein [Acidobacteriota bacterium]
MKKVIDKERLSRRHIGAMGEELAATYLQRKGYRIIERGFRTRYGEIDIIAVDGNVIAFIEVKMRRSETCGVPGDALDQRKRVRIAGMANHFISMKRWDDRICRFDTVLISATCDGSYEVELIKDAFRME